MKKRTLTLVFIIFFSILLWVSVSLSETYIVTIPASIKIYDLPKNNGVSFISSEEIFIQLKGNGWNLAKTIMSGDQVFSIPAKRKVGRHKESLRNYVESNAWLTSSFQVLEIAPSQLEFDIGKIVSKKIKIIPKLNLDFKEGFGIVSNFKVSPDSIEIFGPPGLLNKIDSVSTVEESVTNLSESYSEIVKLKNISGIELSSSRCRISFEVQKIVEKTFADIPVETMNIPFSKELILYPSKVTILLSGGIQQLGRLTNDSLKVQIDYWEVIKQEGKSIQPFISIPRFTKLVNVNPNTLEFIIKQY